MFERLKRMIAVLTETRADAVNLGHPRDPALATLFGATSRTLSGAHVTPESALRQAAVFACVRVATETIASLPVGIYERIDKKKKRLATDYPTYGLLKNGPNPKMTRMEFFENMQPPLELRGNAYAEVEWGGDGYPRAVWPWPNDKVQIEATNKNIKYYFDANGASRVPMRESRVLHVKSFPAGLVGRSAIAYTRDSIGLAISAEEYGARYFSQGVHMKGWVEHPGKLSPDAQKNLAAGIKEFLGGDDNMHGVLPLGEAAKYHEIGINPNEMQFLETRKFQLGDIARIFRIPPHMIGDLERATFSNVEQQAIDFVVHSIRPRVVRWEQALTNALIPEIDRDRYFIEFNLDGLLRGDIKSRYEAHGIGVERGFLTRNEVREMENRDPLDGLDEPLTPMNMGPSGTQDPAPKGTDNNAKAQPAKRSGEPFEIREARAQGRKQLRESFRPVFREAAARIVKREVRELRKKLGESRSADGVETRQSKEEFGVWLETYYAQFGDQVRAGMEPAVNALADAVALQAMQELGEINPADISEMTNAFLDGMAARYTASSLGQLRQLLQDDDFQDKIEQRLGEWIETRSDKVASRETTQLEGAIARAAMSSMGVKKFRWVNVAETCPLCRELNGRIVGANDPFARAGDYINPNKANQDREDDEAVSMKLHHNIFHPPLHDGCDCLLVPEF